MIESTINIFLYNIDYLEIFIETGDDPDPDLLDGIHPINYH